LRVTPHRLRGCANPLGGFGAGRCVAFPCIPFISGDAFQSFPKKSLFCPTFISDQRLSFQPGRTKGRTSGPVAGSSLGQNVASIPSSLCDWITPHRLWASSLPRTSFTVAVSVLLRT